MAAFWMVNHVHLTSVTTPVIVWICSSMAPSASVENHNWFSMYAEGVIELELRTSSGLSETGPSLPCSQFEKNVSQRSLVLRLVKI